MEDGGLIRVSSVGGCARLLPDLADCARHGAAAVGTKAANLGRLLGAGLPVPPGFCLPAEFLAEGCVHDVSGRPRLTPAARAVLLARYREAAYGPVAVRSSSSDEDTAGASAAGIYATQLVVTGAEALVDAVERCLASVESERARAHRGTGPRPAFAIVVQRMVDAEQAGVVYSADPLGGDDVVVINAVWGLAEPLVAGEAAGDLFRVGRDDSVASQLASKTARLTLQGMQAVPAALRERATLGRGLCLALRDLALRVEALFGCPQDLEFAVACGRIHLLQARPIVRRAGSAESTGVVGYLARERRRLRDTVADLRWRGRVVHEPVVLSNGNIAELLPTPTRMSFALFDHLFGGVGGAIARGRRRLGYRVDDATTDGLFQLVAGQPYFVLEIDARTYDTGCTPPVADYLARVAREPGLANYPEMGLYDQLLDATEARERFGPVEGARRHAESEAFHARLSAAAPRHAARIARAVERALREHVAAERARDTEQDDAAALCARAARLIAHMRGFTCVEFVIAARLGFYFADTVRRRLRRLLPADADALLLDLLHGLDGSRISDQAQRLTAVARGGESLADYLEAFGHMARNELEIALPRYHEAPEVLHAELGRLRERGEGDDVHARQVAQRRAAEKALRRRLGMLPRVQHEVAALLADVRWAQRFLPLRETVKYHLVAEYDQLRRVLLALNARLGLPDGEIFHATPDELPGLSADPAAWRSRLARRREARELARQVAALGLLPPVLFAEQEDLGAFATAQDDGSLLHGTPVAPGETVGEVFVLDERTAEADLHALLGPHHVLVARSANLGLAPLLRRVAGLIVEVGGVLAHSACQARESGIPAVVLGHATRRLTHGASVHLDGRRGCVRLLGGHVDEATVARQPQGAGCA